MRLLLDPAVTGDGKAGFGKGNFYAEPVPQVQSLA
jgi:hypothetical protein